MKINIRLVYLYLFSFVGLLIIVIGSVKLVDLGMKTFIFKEADRYEYISSTNLTEEAKKQEKINQINMEKELVRQRQRELSNSLAMIIVGLPLYLYHWRIIQKQYSKE